MARSRWKLAYFSKNVWRLIFKKKSRSASLNKSEPIMLYSRSSSVPLCLSHYYINIHKGRGYRQLLLETFHNKVKFGEYAYTRKLYYYPLKKKKRR